MILCALIWGTHHGNVLAYGVANVHLLTIDTSKMCGKKDVNDNNRGQCVHLTLYASFRIADRIHFLNHIEFHGKPLLLHISQILYKTSHRVQSIFQFIFSILSYLSLPLSRTTTRTNSKSIYLNLNFLRIFFLHVRFELFIDIFRLVSKENSGFS